MFGAGMLTVQCSRTSAARDGASTNANPGVKAKVQNTEGANLKVGEWFGRAAVCDRRDVKLLLRQWHAEDASMRDGNFNLRVRIGLLGRLDASVVVKRFGESVGTGNASLHTSRLDSGGVQRSC
jgi:hypothetical protein